MLDCNESVFKLEKTSGVIRPNTSMTVVMKFVPQHPINYYRKLTCMVHNQVRHCLLRTQAPLPILCSLKSWILDKPSLQEKLNILFVYFTFRDPCFWIFLEHVTQSLLSQQCCCQGTWTNTNVMWRGVCLSIHLR